MVSQRVRDIEISGIRKMFEAAPPDAINLGLGEPDFDPPTAVMDALCEAIRHGQNHYGPSAGLPALREAIASRYRPLDPEANRDNVIVTAGGSEGLVAVALTLYENGDEVLIPDPGFVLYAPHARLAGAVAVPYPLDESTGYQPDFDALEQRVTPRTRAIVVNSPSNPTGGVFSPATVDRLVHFADANGLAIVSDEVYEGMVYEGKFTSFWGKSDRVVVVHSFSKMFAMTGWRLGFVVAPKGLAPDINKVSYHLIACPSTPAQSAALVGLSDALDATRAMVAEFRARRAYISRELNRIPGLHCRAPAGAFYTFPKFDWPGSAPEVAGDLLKRGLISTPGDAFGSLGAGHLRLSFANSRPNLRRAMGILRRYAAEVGTS